MQHTIVLRCKCAGVCGEIAEPSNFSEELRIQGVDGLHDAC